MANAAPLVQGGEDEEVQGDEGGGGVAGEGEDHTGVWGAVGGFEEGDGGEGARFSRLHSDTAEVDGPAEGAFDGGFEEVEFAHGDAAGGDDDVGLLHARLEAGF